MTIINDDSRVISKLEASLTDNARVFIYDCHMFILQDIDDIFIQAKYFRLEFQVTHLLKA